MLFHIFVFIYAKIVQISVSYVFRFIKSEKINLTNQKNQINEKIKEILFRQFKISEQIQIFFKENNYQEELKKNNNELFLKKKKNQLQIEYYFVL